MLLMNVYKIPRIRSAPKAMSNSGFPPQIPAFRPTHTASNAMTICVVITHADINIMELTRLPLAINSPNSEGIYHKIGGSLSRSQTVWGDVSLYAGINGQWSSANLDSSEQFSIGGPTGVRAYAPGEAGASLGMITTTELRYLLPKFGLLPGRLQLSGLFDHGYAVINANPLAGAANERHLYGAGFGVSWQWEQWLSLKSSVAWRLGDEPASGSGDKPMLYVQMVGRF